jgi:predicted hydrocarbon binding protein
MPQSFDFERAWQMKFREAIDEIAGEAVCQQVMADGEQLSATSDRRRLIDWSRQAMLRLATLVDETQHQAIMTRCACQYPKAQLQPMREAYAAEGDIDGALQMLQTQFEAFLRDTLNLSEDDIDRVVSLGWGAAGRRRGNMIVVTKIPKSENLAEYLRETNAEARRQLYCHCPRVRDAIKHGETLPDAYCYCGAGFYQGIWQEILQSPVRVELLASVLRGDEVCTVAIHLPDDA